MVDNNSKIFINLDESNKFTPKMWRNASFEKPDGEFNVIKVELFMMDEWYDYILSLNDKYCPFEKEKVFQQIVDSGECKSYQPLSNEEILHNKRLNMILSKIQFKIQLDNMNLFNQITELIEQAPNSIKIIYNDSNEFCRLSNFIEYLKNNLPITDIELDNLFIEGKNIQI